MFKKNQKRYGSRKIASKHIITRSLLAGVGLGLLSFHALASAPTDFLSFTPITDGLPGTNETGYADSGINNVAYITWNLYTVGSQQFAAYYYENPDNGSDPLNETVVIARRDHGSSTWDILRTGFESNRITDDHNNVNFAIDGDGYMHLSWGMHGNYWSTNSGSSKFNYAISTNPVTGTNALSMGPDLDTMTGKENEVTYPQFYNLPDGDLLYLFREGLSGDGDVYLNRYDTATSSWDNVHKNAGGTDHISLLKGTGFSPDWNSYPNRMVLDDDNRLHMTWTNRFNGDSPAGESGYQTNHDMFYAYSDDFGVSWNQIDGTPYGLEIVDPVAASSVSASRVADLAVSIPEGSSLINQTDMAVDHNNNPMFATWYAPEAGNGDHSRQYMMSFWDGDSWETRQVSDRTIDSPGSQKNEGAVRELGRPIILADDDGRVLLVYRDNEGTNGITVAHTDTYDEDPDRLVWTTIDLTTDNLGAYEVNYDPVMWETENKLHLLYQPQDSLGNSLHSSDVAILEWDAGAYFASLVPEPTSLTLLAMSSLVLVRRRRD